MHGASDLGRIFFFAEFGTAVAGWVLGINPFDQPNVQEAKDNTAKVLAMPGAARSCPPADEQRAQGAARQGRAAELRGDHGLRASRRRSSTTAIAELRARIRDETKATTTFGYGPRFLHSTGQFHKGGPPTGLFLQLVHDGDEDVPVPGEDYTFATLKNAQADGDLQTLRDHGLPAERVRLEGDPVAAPGTDRAAVLAVRSSRWRVPGRARQLAAVLQHLLPDARDRRRPARSSR